MQNMTQTSYNKYERNIPNAIRIQLARIYTTIDYLLGEIINPTRHQEK